MPDTATLAQVIADIDWELLRRQKQLLLDALDAQSIGSMANGLVILIDNIQDAAVAEGIATEVEVFGDGG